AQPDWEEEVALNRLLANVPDAPLSSNFTARVLQAIDLEELREQRARRSASWLGRLHSWIPRMGMAALVVGLALGYQKMQIHSLREKAKNLDTLAGVASTFSEAKIWEDFY